MKLHSKGMKWCRRYEKIPIIPRYETDAQGMKQMHKVWNRCTRYEKCAQGIKQLHKGMKCFFKVWNKCFLEKQWFFIPLWVCFIPFWVWKYRLFFPDAEPPFPTTCRTSRTRCAAWCLLLLSHEHIRLRCRARKGKEPSWQKGSSAVAERRGAEAASQGPCCNSACLMRAIAEPGVRLNTDVFRRLR